MRGNLAGPAALPGLIIVPPHYDRYLALSSAVREIYVGYTDQVEPFGLDECWLDVNGSRELFREGTAIADEIRLRVRNDLGLTVSVGVSFNKIFAKLGSDYKKPDATAVITRDSAQISPYYAVPPIKTIGNSTTAPRDLV